MPKKTATTKKKSYRSRLARSYAWIKQKLTPREYAGPHRSFRLTPKSSYRGGEAAKRPRLAGTFTLLRNTFRLLRAQRKAFVILTAVYVLCSWLLNGLPSSTQYASVRELMDEVLGAEVQSFTGAATLLLGAASGLLTPSKSELAQFITALLAGILSLSSIWVARQHMAGNATSARQALYNAPAPLVVVSILTVILVIQMFPASIGGLLVSIAFGFQEASVSGLLAVLMVLSAILLIMLSLYLIIPTYVAIFVATLPNTYPMAALRSAHLLTYRRRATITMRLLGIALFVALLWLLLIAPVVLFELFVPVPDWLPLLQITIDSATAVSVPIVTVFTYQLYRELL